MSEMSEMTDAEKAAAKPRLWEDWKTVDFKQTTGWFNVYEHEEKYIIKESPGVLIQELQESYYFWFKADKNGGVKMEREYCDREALGRRRVVFSDTDECNELVPSQGTYGYVETVNREEATEYRMKNAAKAALEKAAKMRKEQESRNDRITV